MFDTFHVSLYCDLNCSPTGMICQHLGKNMSLHYDTISFNCVNIRNSFQKIYLLQFSFLLIMTMSLSQKNNGNLLTLNLRFKAQLILTLNQTRNYVTFWLATTRHLKNLSQHYVKELVLNTFLTKKSRWMRQ
jgi:hypothetical protein